MAITPEYSYNDVLSLFQGGGLISENYGYIVGGSISNHIPPQGKNRINSRGTIILDLQYGQSATVTIDCGSNKAIHFDWTYNGDATYDCSVNFTQNGSPYTYEGYTYTGGSSGININLIDYQQRFAWLSTEGMTISIGLVSEVNVSTSSWGFMVIPNIYDENSLYRKEIPIFQSDEREISFVSCEILGDNALDPDTKTEIATVAYHFFEDITMPDISYEDGDPYSPTGGGGGTYVSRNDAVGYPDLPTLSAVTSGMVKLYAPTAAQMLSISEWLWSDDFYDNIIKNFASPMDNIIGLYVSPVVPTTVGDTFKIGNVDSELAVNRVANSYVVRDCGSIQINKYYNSFADFDNYHSFKMFLPYYGIVDLSTDDFMGGSVGVRYNIDCFSGTATICILTQRSNSAPHVLHQYTTNIFSAIPYSGTNMMGFYTQTAASAATLISQGMSGNPIGMTAGISGLISAHPTYGGSRGMSMAGGFMGIQYPYLIECRSIRDMPPSYNKYNGIPSNKFKQVSTLSGYTVFDSIRVSAANATDAELDEIEKILKEGVIL